MTTYAIRNKHAHLRFVEARNEAQAIRHCARGEFTASIPTIPESIEFGRNGGVVETAGEHDTAPEPEVAPLPPRKGPPTPPSDPIGAPGPSDPANSPHR